MEFIVTASARKRGINDDDMLHAVRNAIRVFEQDDDMIMHIGPARDGQLLEVGSIAASDYPGMTLIVHAMPARPKYLR